MPDAGSLCSGRGERQESVIVYQQRNEKVHHHGVANEGHEDHEIDGQQRANPSCNAGVAGDS
jgi:hypothetical protein